MGDEPADDKDKDKKPLAIGGPIEAAKDDERARLLVVVME